MNSRPPSRSARPFGDRIDNRPPPSARKRMLAQGRKAHFMFDLKALLKNTKFDPAAVPAFCETLFQRGTRGSTEDAKAYVVEKGSENNAFTRDEMAAIVNLVERYSFWR